MTANDLIKSENQEDCGTLVFSIKTGETVLIGDAVVRIETRGGRAKVVVRAPKHVKILRGSLKNAG